MKAAGIIPARYASTRFPGKPLAKIAGKTMIQRVHGRVSSCRELTEIIVATDDDRIFSHVKDFGGKVIMTSPSHPSGTHRCAEAIGLAGIQAEIIINIQGDEPFIDPAHISQLINILKNKHAGIATLAEPVEDTGMIKNPSVVKVVMDVNGNALYFSRATIPYRAKAGIPVKYFRHIGLYGYRKAMIEEIVKLGPGQAGQAEDLEQLTWLENGYPIAVGITSYHSISVDVPADLEKAELFARNHEATM